MKKLLLEVVVVAFAGAGVADVLELPFATNHVPSGASVTVSERVTAADGTSLIKTGGGTLVVPGAVVDQRAPLNVQVEEGTLELQNDAGTPPPAATLSDAVKAKLAMWLSVDDAAGAAHLVPNDNGAGIEYWYDVRETDTANPKFVYAKACHLVTADGPVRTMGEYVHFAATETNKMDALYFGGRQSGVSMDLLLPNGTAYMLSPRECTAVTGISNYYGYLFGDATTAGENPVYESDDGKRVNSDTAWVTYGYGWMHCWGPVMGDARVWVDGVELDRSEPARWGFHILHRRRNTINSLTEISALQKKPQALFSWNSSAGKDNSVWRKGGDYLSEVMYFSNTLTRVERLEVQNYLMRKWFGPQRPRADVALAAGTRLSVEVPAGTAERGLDFRATGAGDVVKKGAGTLLYRPSASSAGDEIAGLSIEQGQVQLTRSLAIRASVGDEITAARVGTKNCTTVTVSRVAGACGANLAKAGDAPVILQSVPTGTEALEVRAGTLVLQTPSASPARRYEVPVPNNSFEEWDDPTLTTIPIDEAANCYAGAGWTYVVNSYFYHYDRWQTLSKSGATVYGRMNTTISAYGLDACRPPDGDCALALKQATANVYTTVTIPEDGEYEVAFMMWNRKNYGANGHLSVRLKTADGKAVAADFGQVNQVNTSLFLQHTLRTMVKAGTYRLYLENGFASDIGDENPDILLVVDDVHLYRIGDYRRQWKLPNGGFELVTGLPNKSSAPTKMSLDYGAQGWTFDAVLWRGGGSSASDDYPSLGVVNSLMQAEQGRYSGDGFNGSHRPLGGEYQLLFRKPNEDNTAHVTFTPPEGRWFLRCRAAVWGNYSEPKLVATVRAGGASAELGSLALSKNYTMRPYAWPQPFEADGSTEVTLDLAYVDSEVKAHYGVNADDFELVDAYETPNDLIENGDFEAPRYNNASRTGASVPGRTGWASITYKDAKGNSVGGNNNRRYGSDEVGHYGLDHASGESYVEPYGTGVLYRTVSFARPGFYRFSGLVKTRIYDSNTFVNFAVDLALGSETNRIGLIDTATKGTFEQRTFDFRVEKAGDYTLLLHGLQSYTYYALDDLSIRYLGEPETRAFELPEDLKIKVAAGARLQLDFSGTNTVKTFRANGKSYRGVVSRENCPEIDGPGALFSKGEGLMIMVQ